MGMTIGIAWFIFMAASMVLGKLDNDKGGMLMGGAG